MTTTANATYEELAPSRLEDCRRYLEEARDGAFSATAGLSEAQWNYRPASGGWSIAGIVEHMVVIQNFILGPIAQSLADAPPPSSYEEVEKIDGIVKKRVPDRSRKFSAPESVHPTGRWTPSESLELLSANTVKLIDRLESTPGLRQHCVPSPPLNAITDGEYKLMDGYQWIVAAAGHTIRHTEQILEVKADPGFPPS